MAEDGCQVYQEFILIVYYSDHIYLIMRSVPKKQRVQENPLQKYVRPGLNIYDLQDIKQLFDAFDHQKLGVISPKVLKQAIKQQGPQGTQSPVYQLICDLDSEGQGYIDFQQFIFFLNPNVTGVESAEEIRSLFKMFDLEKTGFINIENLRKILKYLQLQLDEEDIESMMRHADMDEDGFISQEQFYQILVHGSTKI